MSYFVLRIKVFAAVLFREMIPLDGTVFFSDQDT